MLLSARQACPLHCALSRERGAQRGSAGDSALVCLPSFLSLLCALPEGLGPRLWGLLAPALPGVLSLENSRQHAGGAWPGGRSLPSLPGEGRYGFLLSFPVALGAGVGWGGVGMGSVPSTLGLVARPAGLLRGGRERWGRTPSRRTPPFHAGRFQRMHHIPKPLLTSYVASVNSKGPP